MWIDNDIWDKLLQTDDNHIQPQSSESTYIRTIHVTFIPPF